MFGQWAHINYSRFVREHIVAEEPVPLHQFTPAEFARLYTYRLAVRAGYFNEGRA